MVKPILLCSVGLSKISGNFITDDEFKLIFSKAPSLIDITESGITINANLEFWNAWLPIVNNELVNSIDVRPVLLKKFVYVVTILLLWIKFFNPLSANDSNQIDFILSRI